jgi:hypothetical protein
VHNLEWLPHPPGGAKTVAMQFEKILGCAQGRPGCERSATDLRPTRAGSACRD